MYGPSPVLVPHVGTRLLTCDRELREFHAVWLKRKEEEQKSTPVIQEPGGGGITGTEVTAEVETPVAFAPKDLPIPIDIGITSPILHGFEPPSILHDVKPPSDTFADDRLTTVSSPTLSISSVSDLTPTEFDDDIGGSNDERMATRHDTFYFEDGNVEIACGHTVFRVHSTTVSFSSQKLRDILSKSALLHAPMTEGCPRITVMDTAQDFAVLLKMIYTPGWVSPFLRALCAS